MALGTASPPETPLEQLAGSVARVTFHSEETGFCVLRVKVRGHRDLVTVLSTAPTIMPGEDIESQGWWITDRTHGLPFKTMQLRVVPPTTLEGIETSLGSGMVNGIGPHCARTRGRAFGADVFDGQPKACAVAVRKVRAMRRLTTLAVRLRLEGKVLGTRGEATPGALMGV